MASSYSQYKLELISTGEQSGTWGVTTNNNLGSSSSGTYRGIEQAIGGKGTVTFSSATETLTLTDSNDAQAGRALYLDCGGTPGGAATLNVPAVQKMYIVDNGTGETLTVQISGGTGVSIPDGKVAIVYADGTNVVSAVTHIPSLTLGAALPVASGGTGITAFGTGVATALGVNTGSAGAVVLFDGALGTPASGTLTNAAGLPISTGVSGLGANVASFLATPSSSNLAAALTDETGTGELVFATSPTLVTPVLGTPTSGQLSNCTVDGTDAVGFRNIPQNSQSAAYELVLTDSGKHILHPSADTTARTFTIPANSSVAFPIGTAITFINQDSAGELTIAITTDTMRLSPDGTTGSRTLAANGSATCIKITSTEWIISGSGLT